MAAPNTNKRIRLQIHLSLFRAEIPTTHNYIHFWFKFKNSLCKPAGFHCTFVTKYYEDLHLVCRTLVWTGSVLKKFMEWLMGHGVWWYGPCWAIVGSDIICVTSLSCNLCPQNLITSSFVTAVPSGLTCRSAL